jgi:hypothetical protein
MNNLYNSNKHIECIRAISLEHPHKKVLINFIYSNVKIPSGICIILSVTYKGKVDEYMSKHFTSQFK